jgi:hypothetical protein
MPFNLPPFPSGHGTERENLAVEKEYETAAAKGYRPCLLYPCLHIQLIDCICTTGPTCKRMMDLTPNKVFKSSAFEPTDEELTKHARAKRRRRREASGRHPAQDVRIRSPSPKPKALEDRGLDDSDDELPDVSNMFDERPRKRRKKAAGDDVGRFFLLQCGRP